MNRTSPYYCRRSVLSLLISALIYAPPGMVAFTTNVIGVVNDETVDGNQKWMNEVQQITLILSTMASRMFMAGYLMEVLLNLVDIKI